MTPKDFTHKMLIGWGGDSVFSQALQLGKRGAVVNAEWNPETHEATGAITLSSRWTA